MEVQKKLIDFLESQDENLVVKITRRLNDTEKTVLAPTMVDITISSKSVTPRAYYRKNGVFIFVKKF
ncbi:hypothetical protein A3Q56_08168 [Intoshia linei]|uniref:Uncharacterized protein n=1 Tax=Intoshia linei TaxID=1819745 RepID=A0A177AQ56_9BILA|nr:hypothetical protein A3Q56_08168 [Intoshia linei]